jgi:hypothetical protein
MSQNQPEGGPVAQYRLYFKSADAGPKDQFKLAEPGVHRPLFQRPVVVAAIHVIRSNPMLEAVTVRDDLGLYNIVTFAKTMLDPFAELLVPPETGE